MAGDQANLAKLGEERRPNRVILVTDMNHTPAPTMYPTLSPTTSPTFGKSGKGPVVGYDDEIIIDDYVDTPAPVAAPDDPYDGINIVVDVDGDNNNVDVDINIYQGTVKVDDYVADDVVDDQDYGSMAYDDTIADDRYNVVDNDDTYIVEPVADLRRGDEEPKK
ncbi:predicted protein [Thalassiosira pseudonana CCMP1335]|uniref:Uncharacterized protein n=1 Tax=Thalassiosira pseudonana TaxID=35128 RepID=B5YNB7_THAPS|nr:predicted protein [Thalassiosira pseudonana CCMP1335]ACI64959.1 predicted protein [Thalassiosira pseudonana CCMP1335]